MEADGDENLNSQCIFENIKDELKNFLYQFSVVWRAKFKSDVHASIRRPWQENLDNPEKNRFSRIIKNIR